MNAWVVAALGFRALAVVVGCCLCLLAPVRAHGPDGSDGGAVTEVIEAGDVFEQCRVLAPGQRLEYAFTASRPLDFNLHYHVDRAVFYPVAEHRTASGESSFVADSEQEYCLMWTNPASGQVTLSLTFKQGHH